MNKSAGKRKQQQDSNTQSESSKRIKTAKGAVKVTRDVPKVIQAGPSSGRDEVPSTSAQENGESSSAAGPSSSSTSKPKIRKLVPQRPFPTVPTCVSATGPRSAHHEGKNMICVTRKTKLASYLRRCKSVFMEYGYKTLHLSAMGAAIPHLAMLAVSLPPILPYPPDEIYTSYTTGSVDVHDEVIPEDDDEDITYNTRVKSTLAVVIKIGNGDEDGAANEQGKGKGKGKGKGRAKKKSNRTKPIVREGSGSKDQVDERSEPDPIVLQEPEQEEMDES